MKEGPLRTAAIVVLDAIAAILLTAFFAALLVILLPLSPFFWAFNRLFVSPIQAEVAPSGPPKLITFNAPRPT